MSKNSSTFISKQVIIRTNARTVLYLKSLKLGEKLFFHERGGPQPGRRLCLPRKLRFLRHVDDSTFDWWARHRKRGAVLLEKTAEGKSLSTTVC